VTHASVRRLESVHNGRCSGNESINIGKGVEEANRSGKDIKNGKKIGNEIRRRKGSPYENHICSAV